MLVFPARGEKVGGYQEGYFYCYYHGEYFCVRFTVFTQYNHRVIELSPDPRFLAYFSTPASHCTGLRDWLNMIWAHMSAIDKEYLLSLINS